MYNILPYLKAEMLSKQRLYSIGFNLRVNKRLNELLIYWYKIEKTQCILKIVSKYERFHIYFSPQYIYFCSQS